MHDGFRGSAASLQTQLNTQPLLSLANEADPAQTTPLIGLGNEFPATSADGWALISRYGDWPHSEGIQRVTRASAEEMVRHFKSLRGRIKRAIVGLPIYNGHPDHPAFANTHTDKTEQGQFSDLEARDDGFWGKPVLSAAGAALVEAGKKYLSANWRARQTGLVNGIRIFEPCILDSVGLTANPNIPGPSLANSTSFPAMNKTKLIALLTRLGLTVAADSTDEQLNQAVEQGESLANSLSQRPEKTALVNEQTALATEKKAREAAETALANEQTARKAERAARVTLLLDAAQSAGRITAAQRPAWQARLDTNFDVESTALSNEKPSVKTTATTANLGERKAEADGSQTILSLVNAKEAAFANLPAGQRFDAAYRAVKRERPELFGKKA